jgi:hypothetical protein
MALIITYPPVLPDLLQVYINCSLKTTFTIAIKLNETGTNGNQKQVQNSEHAYLF